MDYKKIIPSRKTRLKILNFLSFIPDETMLKIQYRMKTGRKLNLENPVRYTEKIQWYKLNYHDPLMIECVDKYEVRNYIKRCGLESILSKVIGVYDNPEEIPFELLPNQFTIKDTLSGGGNDIIFVDDKNSISKKELEKQLYTWIRKPLTKSGGREWPFYSGKKHRILIAEYILPNGNLTDYKFFCFNGKVYCSYVISDRKPGGHGKLAIMDRNFVRMNVHSLTQEKMENDPLKPDNYEEMVQIAETLAKPFPHVRVDLYNIQGKIIFGELTFYGASGYQMFDPDGFDYELGEKFHLIER